MPEADYRYFAISVEPDPDPNPAADSRWTIAGVFPNPELLIVTGTPSPILEPEVTTTPPAPVTLPITGASEVNGWLFIMGALMLGLGLGAIVLGRNSQAS